MSTARERMLVELREALASAPVAVAPAAPAEAQPGDPRLFVRRVGEYGGAVTEVDDGAEVGPAVAAILRRHRSARIVVPPSLPPAWQPPGFALVTDDPPLAIATLAAADTALTGSALAIAETGTIVLEGGASQGRRVLSLLPDLHVCVVVAAAVVADLPDAIAALPDPSRPLTFISGPSATSDIELERVEGVHGPRRLEVVLVAAGAVGGGDG